MFGGSFSDQTTISDQALTDRTPAAANFNGVLYYVYKRSGTTQLMMINHGENEPANIPQAHSSEAPAVVVAVNRLWVFFRGIGGFGYSADYSIYYTSFDGSSWTSVRSLPREEPNVGAKTALRPEVIEHAGRVWLLFDGAAQGKVSMTSFLPSLNGDVSVTTRVVELLSADMAGGPLENLFVTAFRFGDFLRVYYSHNTGEDPAPVFTLGKLGGG